MKKMISFITVWLVSVAAMAQSASAAKGTNATPGTFEVVRDVVFGKGGARSLKMNLLRPTPAPKEPMPVVVFIFGGSWRTGDNTQGIKPLTRYAQRGYFCASIEYRLSQEALWPAQIEDCKCAIRFLRSKAKEYNINPDKIAVWGVSSGGHLAALLGTSSGVKELEGNGGWPEFSSRVNAVVDCFGPIDFLKMDAAGTSLQKHDDPLSPESRLIGGPIQENRAKANQASPLTYVSTNAPPFLILHGTADPLVPLNQSEMLAEALKKAKVEVNFQPIPVAGHGFVEGQVEDFIDAFLYENLMMTKPKTVKNATAPAAGAKKN